jgi:hypothetical protein
MLTSLLLARIVWGGLALADPPLLCPDGMVLVHGAGVLGMKGQPYGFVPTAHLAKVEAPERGCAAAIAATEGASACWVQTDLIDPVIPVHEVTVEPFCIDAAPIPGPGHPYPKDGMSVWDASQLDLMLQSGRFGKRRLCTTTEFQAAVAGLNGNRRFVFGDEYREGICDGDLIGASAACSNPETGVSEYGAVHSHWTIADSAFVASACESPPCTGAGNRAVSAGMYIVAGGTGRFQTRQAPLTPHTWHDHGDATPDACGFNGWDDQAVICASPGKPSAAERAAWTAFIGTVRRTKSMRAAISEGLGKAVCPG